MDVHIYEFSAPLSFADKRQAADQMRGMSSGMRKFQHVRRPSAGEKAQVCHVCVWQRNERYLSCMRMDAPTPVDRCTCLILESMYAAILTHVLYTRSHSDTCNLCTQPF